MFEQNPQIREWVEIILQYASYLNRGDILEYIAIEEATEGLNRSMPQWGTVVRKLKKRMLRDRGIDIVAVVNVGFRLRDPQDQLTNGTSSRQERARRNLRSGREVAEHLPDNELTHHQKRLKMMIADQIEEDERRLSEHLKSQHIAQNERMPRPPIED